MTIYEQMLEIARLAGIDPKVIEIERRKKIVASYEEDILDLTRRKEEVEAEIYQLQNS